MALNVQQIEAREKEIAKQIELLKQEASELAIARRVFEKYSTDSGQSFFKLRYDVPQKIALAPGAPRPSEAPTTFEMVDVILAGSEADGKDGLTAKELINGIRDRFWPGLASHQVLPTIYGFVKNNRLHKTAGGKFKRIKKA